MSCFSAFSWLALALAAVGCVASCPTQWHNEPTNSVVALGAACRDSCWGRHWELGGCGSSLALSHVIAKWARELRSGPPLALILLGAFCICACVSARRA